MKKRLFFIFLSIALLVNIFLLGFNTGVSYAAEEKITASVNNKTPYSGQEVKLTVGYDCPYIVAGSIIEILVPDGLVYNKYEAAGSVPIDTVSINDSVITILQSEGEEKKTDLVVLYFTLESTVSEGDKCTFDIKLIETTDKEWVSISPDAKTQVTLTVAPTPTPTPKPTPTIKPTAKPTATPTQKPTTKPTKKPTSKPTTTPTLTPTITPTLTPENTPAVQTPGPFDVIIPENYIYDMSGEQIFALGYVDGGSFGGEPILEAEDITLSEYENIDLILEAISNKLEDRTCIAVYTIWIYENDNIYIPEKLLSFMISTTKEMENYSDYKIVYVDDNLDSKLIPCEIKDNVICFNNSNPGYFVLIGRSETIDPDITPIATNTANTPLSEENEGVSPGTLVIAMIVAIFVSLWVGVGIGFLIWGKSGKTTRYSNRDTGGWY